MTDFGMKTEVEESWKMKLRGIFISEKGYFEDIEKFHNNVGRKIRV